MVYSYLLLCNKLPPNLVSYTHLLFHYFCGAGVQSGLLDGSGSWPHEAAINLSAGVVVSSESSTGRGYASKPHSCGHQQGSVP